MIHMSNNLPENLTLEQERFCQCYTQDSDLFGNATLSYAEAYNRGLETKDRTRQKDEKGFDIVGTSEYDKEEHYCGAAGSRLMRNDRVLMRINVLFQEKYLTDLNADATLAKVMASGTNTEKLAAIKQYNELKGRITKKLDLSSLGNPVSTDNAELKEFIRETRADRAQALKEKLMQ